MGGEGAETGLAHSGPAAKEVDTGPRDRSGGTERLCIATRTVQPIAGMVRFVVGPDGAVVPDVKRKLPGRGVWVTGTRQAVEQAAKRGAFARGFKRNVAVPAELAAQTERLLERSALDALAIAAKSGLVVAGFAKVEAALAQREVVVLLQAAEAAADGVRKLAGAVHKRMGAEGRVLPIMVFQGVELDLALGRSNVIHAAVLAGSASEALLARYRSLERFRGGEPVKPAVECG